MSFIGRKCKYKGQNAVIVGEGTKKDKGFFKLTPLKYTIFAIQENGEMVKVTKENEETVWIPSQEITVLPTLLGRLFGKRAITFDEEGNVKK